MNSINLIGNLTKPIELKYMPGGENKAVAQFTIGVKRPFSADKSDFFNIVVYGKQAENCATYLDKGSKVGINGYLTNRSYEAKDGGKRYITEVIAGNVEFLTPKSEKTQTNSDYSDMEPIEDSDIPF